MKKLFLSLLLLTITTAQINDKNFKSEIGDGFYVVVFTSEWQEKDLDLEILKGVKGHEDAKIYEVKSSNLKKICKKLRIRNYPSIALFHNGSKKEVWKADMDGEIECSSSEIKEAIDEIQAGDVF